MRTEEDQSSSENLYRAEAPSLMVTLTVFDLPEGGEQSIRCGPAGSSSPPRGVTPRATPSIDTEQFPGLATIANRPLPMPCLTGALRVATGSESTEMTGTSLEFVAAGGATIFGATTPPETAETTVPRVAAAA
jgi:hypothetical protein